MKVKSQVFFGKTLKTDTIYIGYDNVEYKAVAELTIDDEGGCQISRYNYFDPISCEEKETEERDWDRASIERTFDIEITD